MPEHKAIACTSIRDTISDLDTTSIPGHLEVALDPVSLWVFTASGWQALGTPQLL
jgi:hypothetical protein